MARQSTPIDDPREWRRRNRELCLLLAGVITDWDPHGLIAHDLCWVKVAGDDPHDQCAHGKIVFRVNGTVFVAQTASEAAWRTAVLGFAKQIEDFYATCQPKAAIDDEYDRAGWAVFWQEWRRSGRRAFADARVSSAYIGRVPR